ncbi:MAG TPA: DUF6527 family protein [Dehalococcoidia bacterium]|nr:DUF6527 family protein [Dehalococcoidia bacterium]
MIRFVSRTLDGIRQWLGGLAARFGRRRRLRLVRAEELPERLSLHNLYVVGERGEDWFAAMVCPCGCGATIDLNLVPPGRPCWKLTVHADGTPSLSPSVWRQVDCKAHYFVQRGRIVWARPSDE